MAFDTGGLDAGFGAGFDGSAADFGGGSWGGGLDGAPDIGTIGGNLTDAFGETSVTWGGGLGEDQAFANSDFNNNNWGYDFNSAGFSNPFGFDRFDLGNFFGANFSQGLPTAVSPVAYSSAPTFASVMDSPFGRLARTVAGITNPVLGAALNSTNALAQGQTSQGVGGLVGLATNNGLLGAGTTIGMNAAQGRDVSRDVGGLAGGFLGSTIGGQMTNSQLGAMFGGELGGRAGAAAASGRGATDMNTSNAIAPTGGSGMSSGEMVGLGLGALGALYANRQAERDARSNVTDLGSMFGPDSAYAQQLRQQLERRDAASGRRSQYGPREVELQARLAELAARSAPGIAQSNMAAQQVANQRRAQNLNALYALGRESGLFQRAGNALSGLFQRQPTSTANYSLGTPASFRPLSTPSSSTYSLGGGMSSLGLQPSSSSFGLSNWRF